MESYQYLRYAEGEANPSSTAAMASGRCYGSCAFAPGRTSRKRDLDGQVVKKKPMSFVSLSRTTKAGNRPRQQPTSPSGRPSAWPKNSLPLLHQLGDGRNSAIHEEVLGEWAATFSLVVIIIINYNNNSTDGRPINDDKRGSANNCSQRRRHAPSRGRSWSTI